MKSHSVPLSPLLLLLTLVPFSGSISVTNFSLRSEPSSEPLTSSLLEEDTVTYNVGSLVIPENYSIHLPPPNIPVPVQLSLLIFNVFDIEELRGHLSLEANFKIFWRDERLSNLTMLRGTTQKYIVIDPDLIKDIWHPDVFIDHMKGKSNPHLISKAASLRLYADGSLRYSSRLLLTMACRMDFHLYPADTQECHIDLKSYAYPSSFLSLSWREPKGPQLAYPLHLHNFDVFLETAPDYVQKTRSASYDALRFTVFLRRKLSYHIIQTFIPSSLLTIVSWLSFLVPVPSTPGRMAICVTTLLTLTAQFAAIRQQTPSVSYVKALDTWMVVCILFVFTALAEYTTVLKLQSMKPRKIKPRKEPKSSFSLKNQALFGQPLGPGKATEEERPESALSSNGSGSSSPKTGDPLHPHDYRGFGTNGNRTPLLPKSPEPEPEKEKEGPTKFFLISLKLEKYTPRTLPCLFVLFNAIYWPYLLTFSGYLRWYEEDGMFYTI